MLFDRLQKEWAELYIADDVAGMLRFSWRFMPLLLGMARAASHVLTTYHDIKAKVALRKTLQDLQISWNEAEKERDAST